MNADIIHEIMMKTDYRDIRALARINKAAYKIYRSEVFWKNRYIQDYGMPNYSVEKWRTEYLFEYKTKRRKRLYNLAWVNGASNILKFRAKNRNNAVKFIAYACNKDLLAQNIIATLICQYQEPKITKSEQLKSLCVDYIDLKCQNHPKYNESIKSYISGTGWESYLNPNYVTKYYLKPNYLYYLCNEKERISYFNLFKYLYAQKFQIELVSEPFGGKIVKPYLTARDIDIMLNNKRSDGYNSIELSEEEYYDVF